MELNVDYIYVRVERKYIRIIFADIFYIEAIKNYVAIHLGNQSVITRMTLNGIYRLLPQKAFIYVNRSNICNLEKIEAFDNNDLFVNNQEIAISNKYKDEVFRYLLAGHSE